MTALSSVFVSMTSLLSFSRALDVVSSNVANLNTPGFKGSDLLFSALPGDGPSMNDVHSLNGGDVTGAGTTVTGAGRRFVQGELRETGTGTHLAIQGVGFFVLSGKDGVYYTRSGQFEQSADGRLLDPQTGAVLQAFQGGGLADLAINPLLSNPPQATARVSLAGNLSPGDQTQTVQQVVLFDAAGERRVFSLILTNNAATTPGSWKVSLKNAQGVEQLPATAEIRFQGTGSPAAGLSVVPVTLTAADGRTSTVQLNFGTPGSFDGVTSFSTGTSPPNSPPTIRVGSADGFGLGQLTAFNFDSQGQATLTFSNGQTGAGPRVALATFADAQRLVSEDGVRFTAPEDTQVSIVGPGESGRGAIVAQSLELANVELAREFADIIILQRGFQASSQILNVSSQLIEDIYNSVSGRG